MEYHRTRKNAVMTQQSEVTGEMWRQLLTSEVTDAGKEALNIG